MIDTNSDDSVIILIIIDFLQHKVKFDWVFERRPIIDNNHDDSVIIIVIICDILQD